MVEYQHFRQSLVVLRPDVQSRRNRILIGGEASWSQEMRRGGNHCTPVAVERLSLNLGLPSAPAPLSQNSMP